MADIIVSIILILIIGSIILHIIKNKKKGKSCCGCSCGDCSKCK